MRIEVVKGDITWEVTDAIVNAANSSLLGGGGVDGAIHEAAGPELLRQCRALRKDAYREGLPVGQAVATGAGRLKARWVIHTVGPNAHRGQTDPALLASCFSQSLALAQSLGATSIAFPAISAGVYGWPAPAVAEVAAEVMSQAQAEPGTVELVRFVLFSQSIYEDFVAAFPASQAA